MCLVKYQAINVNVGDGINNSWCGELERLGHKDKFAFNITKNLSKMLCCGADVEKYLSYGYHGDRERLPSDQQIEICGLVTETLMVKYLQTQHQIGNYIQKKLILL